TGQVEPGGFDVLFAQPVVVRPVLVLLQRDLLFHLFQRQAVGNPLADDPLQLSQKLDGQRNVSLREEITMATGESIEIQRINGFVRRYPLRQRMAVEWPAGAGQ